MFIFFLCLSFITEEITLLHYSSSILYPRRSLRTQIVVATILYFFLFLISLLKLGVLNAIMYFFVNVLFLYTQYKISLLFTLFHSAVLTSIMGFSELIVYVVLESNSTGFLTAPGTDIILYAILSKMLFFSIVYFLAYIFKNKKARPDYYDKILVFLLFIPISCFFIMLTLIKLVETFHFVYPLDLLVFISAILLLLINILAFSLNQYQHRKNTDFLDMQLQLQKEDDLNKYYRMLLAQHEDQTILIHDIKKHLQSIDHMNSTSGSSEIHAYIQQLLNSTELKTSAKLCDNELLNSILCRYQRACDQKRITLITDIRKNTLTFLQHNELTALFCNLLDNAVEACNNIPEAFIDVSVQKKEHSPYTVVIIINSCKDTPAFDHNHLPVSSKKNGTKHGYGVKSIIKIAEKYNGDVQMYYEESTAQFHTIITLKEK